MFSNFFAYDAEIAQIWEHSGKEAITKNKS